MVVVAAGVWGCACAASGDARLASSHLPFAWTVAALFCGLGGSALFTILDYAVFSIDASELDELARMRPHEWGILQGLRRQFSQTWLALQCGATIFNLLFALSVLWIAIRLAGGTIGAASLTLGAIAAIGSVVVFGEVLPGILMGRRLHAFAPMASRITRLSVWILAPLHAGPLHVMRLMAGLAGFSLQEGDRVLEVEKRLLTLIGVGEVDVALEEEEREMIDHALEFGDLCARDIMTPRAKIESFEDSLTQEEVLEIMRRAPYSRILVQRKSLDDLVGILHAKLILLDPQTDYHQHIAPPLFVPEDMQLIELTALMRKRRSHLVVVLDEYGATVGIVSMSDVLEAIVGPDVHHEIEGRGDDSPAETHPASEGAP